MSSPKSSRIPTNLTNLSSASARTTAGGGALSSERERLSRPPTLEFDDENGGAFGSGIDDRDALDALEAFEQRSSKRAVGRSVAAGASAAPTSASAATSGGGGGGGGGTSGTWRPPLINPPPPRYSPPAHSRPPPAPLLPPPAAGWDDYDHGAVPDGWEDAPQAASSGAFSWDGVNVGAPSYAATSLSTAARVQPAPQPAVVLPAGRPPPSQRSLLPQPQQLQPPPPPPPPPPQQPATAPAPTAAATASTADARTAEFSRRLLEKDKELERLETVLLAVTPVPGMDTKRLLESTAAGRGGATLEDMRDVKVLELAKKNRALQLALGRERDRVARLEERLQGGGDGGGSAVAGSGGRAARAVKGAEGAAGGVAAGEVAADSAMLRTQNRSLAAQLQKAQHHVDLLKAEVAGCHRALTREVGPDVPLARVLAAHSVPRSGLSDGGEGESGGGGGGMFAPGDWRGRAQTIATLRTRVRALERELSSARVDDDAATLFAMQAAGAGAGAGSAHLAPDGGFFVDPATGAPLDTAFGLGLDEGGAGGGGGTLQPPMTLTARGVSGATLRARAPAPNVDDKAIALLSYKNEGKSTKVMALQAELAAANAATEKARADAVGAKARCSVLEADVKKLRVSTRSLLLKTETDDRLVERLRLELATNQAEKLGLAADLNAARSQASPSTSAEAARDAAVARSTIAKLKEHVGVLRGLVEARGHAPPPMPPLPSPFDATPAASFRGDGGGGAVAAGGASPQRARAEQQRLLEQVYLQQQAQQQQDDYHAHSNAAATAAQEAQTRMRLLAQQQEMLLQHKLALEEQGIELALASRR